MGAHAAISHALLQRRMMPFDGHCVCGYCKRTNLNRSQMADVKRGSEIADAVAEYGGSVCTTCVELIWYDVDNARIAEKEAAREAHLKHCPECSGARPKRSWDYVRQQMHTDWCPACDGRSL